MLDLGLARFTDEDRASLTVAYDENVLGTADYLAPEQALDSHGVDARADIYGLGCSLYYLLTGHPPFPEGTLPQRLMMHQKQQPPSIRKDRADAPQDLVAICLRMMAKKPEERFQTAQKVAEALANWLTAHGHAVDSGIGSGSSSGRLVAAASGQAKAARRAGSPPPRQGAKRARSSRRDSGEVKRPQGMPPLPGRSESARDTASGLNGPTVKGPGPAPARGFAGQHSDSNVSGKKELKVARPLEESSTSGFAIQAEPSPALARLRARNPLSREEIEAYRKRRKGTPIWLWATIGAGALVVIILLIILALGS